ncbi:hypothetical protein WJX82_001248 [Trebouxia sp. C0006]
MPHNLRSRRSTENSLGPGAQVCSTSFLGQPVPSKRKSSLMRKQMELLRHGCKILRLQAEGNAHDYSSSASNLAYGSYLPSHAQRSGRANNGGVWERKIYQARMLEENQRSSREAYTRANPPDPAQLSCSPTYAQSAVPAKPGLGRSKAGVNGGSASHSAVAVSAATQASSTEFQEAVQETESEYDLHSPTVNHLAAMALSDADDNTDQETSPSDKTDQTVPADICVVTTAEEARRVVHLLRQQFKHMIFACDTEVKDIDLSKESPCGHGFVTCFSIYGGTVDNEVCNFAADENAPRQDQLWVDTMLDGNEEASKEMFAIFKEFFEDPKIKKVWHNYSFDRHVLRNHGIDCQGFTGDTMHMARLWDSSRQGKGYSLESLTGDKKLMADYVGSMRSKTGMKTLFGKKNIKKDNTEGKLTVLPAVEDLQTDEATRARWIDYSAYDAKATWQLCQALRKELKARPCVMDARVQQAVQQATGLKNDEMYEMYGKYWLPFGLLLTDMEKEGMSVNREHLRAAEVQAEEDQKKAMGRFRRWASSKVPGAENMNVGSGAQIRQLLFAGVQNQKPDKGSLELERVFKAPNTEGWVDPNSKSKKPRKNIDFTLHSLWGKQQEGATPVIQPEIFTASGWPAVSTPVLRALAGKPGAAKRALHEQYGDTGLEASADEIPVEALVDDDELDSSVDVMVMESKDDDMEAVGAEPGKQQSAGVVISAAIQSASQMDAEASQKGYGKAYAAFKGGREGLEACAAIDALCELGAIDTLLSNFIKPLQGSEIATRDSKGNLDRIHCSLNINTETGRLSARRPNLQNQPALEKDRYKVRKAFTADVSKGHTLVVADYGQLELRILAHMADCTSMINAFKLGGDFHSRTALGMYDHIKEAINKGECMLEWDGEGKAPVPLLKEMFASERRKAKVLNFSIAYGKTAHGLSKDWKVSLEEAKDTVERWYSDRKEVKLWQGKQQKQAEKQGYVCTLLGRQRQLPDASKKGPGTGAAKGHAMRAAINTPVQGSAADVATAAMISINRCGRLKELGWKLLLQVHDEVILEGPKESALEAQRLVLACMERPFDGRNPLLVGLVVDSKIADTWYEAK